MVGIEDINELEKEVEVLKNQLMNKKKFQELLSERDKLLKEKKEFEWKESKIGKAFSNFLGSKDKDDKGGLL